MSNSSNKPGIEATMLELERKLRALAIEWRGNREESVVQEYHAVYNQMVALGWDESLDEESHLLPEFMPEAYHQALLRRPSGKPTGSST
jgi:hypothetical protein